MIRGFTISIYIARMFAIAIFGTFAVCGLLIFMIDFVELLRMSGKYGSVPTSTLVTIALLRLGAYVEFMMGFAVLVGSIAALISLNRRSELAVMRAGGISVWQFLRPGLVVGIVVGIVGTVIYNPLAAHGRADADKLFAKAFGNDGTLMRTPGGGSWIQQQGVDGESILGAAAASNRGLLLTGVMLIAYDHEGRFAERVDASQGELKDGYWQLKNAWVSRLGEQPEKYDSYLVSTYLTPDRVQEALGTVFSISFWDLPGLIEDAEKAKLSTERLRVQYETLWARPLLCVAMVLLAATVSLRSFRSGGVQTMVTTGMLGGVGFFLLSEITRQIGIAGLAPPWVAAWLPIVLVLVISTTVLLHQEDG